MAKNRRPQLNLDLPLSARWLNSLQIAGYRAQVKASINAQRSGNDVVIDWATAQALISICDQAIHTEQNAHKRNN